MRFRQVGVLCLVSLGLGLGLSVGAVQAQSSGTTGCKGDEGNTHTHWGWGSSEQVCELRTTVFAPGVSHVEVRGINGGIEMVGEDRNNILLEARVIASASSRDAAKELLGKVKIVTEGVGSADLRIHEDGPRLTGWFSSGGYSVNYRLRVPKHLSVELRTSNGGIDMKHLEGTLRADTTNGGLALEDLAGDVHAETVNGGIELSLSGDRWSGGGLTAKSVNGGITVTVSKQYSAHLLASTVNGGVSVGFPVTIEGKLKDNLDTNLGQGGATIRLETVNGPVSIDK